MSYKKKEVITRLKQFRIIEAYCSKPLKKVKHPDWKKMMAVGNCVVFGIGKTKLDMKMGAGTIKIIEVDPRDLRAIATQMKRERKRKK